MILFENSGYAFKNPELLDQALTHKSYHNENLTRSKGHNERLEFLGDAVLDLALSDYLMATFPEMSEGELSKIRASLVNESVLADLAREYGVSGKLRLGKGEIVTGGEDKPRLLASAFEAIFGAIYLDSGFASAKEETVRVFSGRISQLDLTNHFQADYKTRLQEIIQRQMKTTPGYELDREEGPDHDKKFYVNLLIQGQVALQGNGRTKKQAEQDAARLYLQDVLKVN